MFASAVATLDRYPNLAMLIKERLVAIRETEMWQQFPVRQFFCKIEDGVDGHSIVIKWLARGQFTYL